MKIAIRLSRAVSRCRHQATRASAALANMALSFVYPPMCHLCGREVYNSHPTFCDECLSKLIPAGGNECPRCGAPVGPFTNLDRGCGQCRQESFAFDRLIRLGIYDGEMRIACLRAKAEGGSSLARGLADLAAQSKRTLFEEFSLDLVVPVPEHWTRRFLHRHYAAEVVSRQLSRRMNIRWQRSVLVKSRLTPKQATSPITQRRRQQQGSFQVRYPEQVRGKTILLVDDILTTGSTAHAAARVLKSAGARRVIVAVIAVSPLRR